MKETSLLNWVSTLSIHALIIGLPILGYLSGSIVIGNFASFVVFLWGCIGGIITLLFGVGTLAAWLIDDQQKKIDLYEQLTKKSLLGYISRILTIITPFVLVFTGYVVAGVWYAIWTVGLIWIISTARKHYNEHKVNLVPKG